MFVASRDIFGRWILTRLAPKIPRARAQKGWASLAQLMQRTAPAAHPKRVRKDHEVKNDRQPTRRRRQYRVSRTTKSSTTRRVTLLEQREQRPGQVHSLK